MNGDLSFSEGVFHPTKVKFSVGVKELYNFQIAHSKYVGLTTLLSRSYPGIFDLFFEVNEKEFSKRLTINETALKQQLLELEKYGILDVSWSTALPTVTFLHERLPDDYLSLSDKAYSVRKENALRKVLSSMNFLRNDSCRSVQLLSYFGQNSYDCGNCDVCIKANHTNNINEKEMIIQLIQFLQSPQSEDDCIDKFKIEKNTLRQVLKKLLLNGKIKVRENKYFSSF
jgi:ATP-dependent DNA helicase RecQ